MIIFLSTTWAILKGETKVDLIRNNIYLNGAKIMHLNLNSSK